MPEQLTGWPVLRQALLALVLLAVAGALSGLLWEWLWTPPTGVVVDHQWLQDERGLRGDFSGTGTYVAVAAVIGLLAGAAVAVLFDRSELVTLAVVLVGSLLAGWLMYRVGLAVGPPDPHPLAETARNGSHLPGELVVSGWSPFVAFPSGALVGLLVVFFGLSGRRARP
jgi:hypothetical protein